MYTTLTRENSARVVFMTKSISTSRPSNKQPQTMTRSAQFYICSSGTHSHRNCKNHFTNSHTRELVLSISALTARV